MDSNDLKDLVRLREQLLAHDESNVIDGSVSSVESMDNDGPDDPDVEVGPEPRP